MPAILPPLSDPSTSTQIRGVDVHAVHKSATMFLFHFFKHLSAKHGFQYFSENNVPANAGKLAASNQRNFCRCPIRNFEPLESTFDYPTNCHRIFHIRDPRDILVSEYFSFGWIHPTQDSDLDQVRNSLQKMSIDDYVLHHCTQREFPLERRYSSLIERTLDPNLETVVTYETMVTNFPKWLSRVVPVFGIRHSRLAVLQLAWRYRNEFRTKKEAMTHKRCITPGDHRRKLKPSTIDALNLRFESILTKFGYEF
ncbi:hypothetical protein OAL19_00285 [bacterium]|nr:hypothetical protein [bacterium]